MSVFSRPIVQAIRPISRIPFYGQSGKVQTLADLYASVDFPLTLRRPADSEDDSDCRIVSRPSLKQSGKFIDLSTRLTSEYKLFHHKSAIDQFIAPIVGMGGEIIHHRVTSKGAKFFAVVKLPTMLKLSAHNPLDTGECFYVFCNGVNGQSGIFQGINANRSLCQNCIPKILANGMGRKRKHYGKNFADGIERQFLELSNLLEQGEEMARFYQQLSDVKIVDDHRPVIDRMLIDLLGDLKDTSKSAQSRAEGRWERYKSIINSDRADDETYGGVAQAMIEMEDHYVERRVSDDLDGGVDTNRFLSLVEGASANRKEKWVNTLADLANV